MKRIHYLAGLVLIIFIILHVFNHIYSLCGAEAHIEVMNVLRVFYRNPFVETLLLLSVGVQVFSGIKLVLSKRKKITNTFEKIQICTGLYLILFLLIHLSAVLSGRIILNLDTNFYFGVAGLNTFPLNLFFIPYYSLAIISFFGHLSAVHASKMKVNILGFSPTTQSYIILLSGVVMTLVILYGLTNGYKGVKIPKEYSILI